LLQADAAKLREAVLHDRRQAADDIARLAVEIADVCARRDDLAVPPWLDEPAVARLAGLPDRLGAHRKAAGDRPRLASLLTAREAEVQALVAELRGGASTQATTTLHAATATTTTVATATMAVGVAEQARVRTLSLSEAALIQGQAQATRALDEIERRHRGRRDAIAALPPDEDSAPLRRLLRRIEREGDLESQHQEAARERENMMADLDRRLPPLGLAGKTGGEVLALPVPAPESVERFAGTGGAQ
jgi:hypothetical protein